MQINSGKSFYYGKSRDNNSNCSVCSAYNGSFTGLNFNKQLKSFLTLPNKKLKTYSINDYKNLTELDKKILRFEYNCATLGFNNNFYKNTEAIHDKVTDYMKTALDNKYGEGKYIILTIGRSLSSIGKVLGYKIGEENVINIPLSSAHRFLGKNSIKGTSQDEFDGFRKFLSSVGITKNKIKKSNKNYILTDFCCSGSSLQGTIRLFKSNKILGKQSNIVIENIYNLIPDTKDTMDFKNATMNYLYESKFKRYSFVQKNENLSNTSNAITNTSNAKKMTKLMWFKLLDNFMKGVKPSKDTLNDIKMKHPFLD